MDSKAVPDSHVSGRPRSAQAREATLAAALRLIKREGFARLTIEGIAREAGVGKPTIYRWWPSKAAVVFEALQHDAIHTLPMPPSGPLQMRLVVWLEALFDVLNGDTGEIVSGLMAEAQRDPQFAEAFRTEFISARRQPLLMILREGINRGELPTIANVEVLADLIYGAMWYRLLTQHAPLDATYAQDIVRALLPASD